MNYIIHEIINPKQTTLVILKMGDITQVVKKSGRSIYDVEPTTVPQVKKIFYAPLEKHWLLG